MTYREFSALIKQYTRKIYNGKSYLISNSNIDLTLFQGSFPYEGKTGPTEAVFNPSDTSRNVLTLNQGNLLPKWKAAISNPFNYPTLFKNINNYLSCNIVEDQRCKNSTTCRTYTYEIEYQPLANNLLKALENHLKSPTSELAKLFSFLENDYEKCKISIFILIQTLADTEVSNPELIKYLKKEFSYFDKEKETEILDQLKELSGNMTFLEAIFLENKELFSLDEIIIGIKNRTNLSELIGAAYQQFDSEYSKYFLFKTSLTDTSKMILTTLFLSPEEKQPHIFLRNIFDALAGYQDTIFFLKQNGIINLDGNYYQINYFHREALKDICLTSDYNQNKELLELLVKKYESSNDLIRKQLLPIIIALMEKINFKYIETFRAMYCFRIIKTNYQINTEMMKKIQVWLSN